MSVIIGCSPILQQITSLPGWLQVIVILDAAFVVCGSIAFGIVYIERVRGRDDH